MTEATPPHTGPTTGSTTCVKCGACAPVCPVYRITGRESHTARGRHHLLAKLDRTQRGPAFAEIFAKCLLCGACTDTCPRDLDTPAAVVEARSNFPKKTGRSFVEFLSRRAVQSPRLLAGLQGIGRTLGPWLASRLPEESGLLLKLITRDLEHWPLPKRSFLASRRPRNPGSSQTSYFVGCLANHLAPQIARATEELARRQGDGILAAPARQTCCGLAHWAAGNLHEARSLAKQNILAFAKPPGPILTSCSSCYTHLLTYPELLAEEPAWQEKARDFAKRLQEFSTFFQKLPPMAGGQGLTSPGRVLYHDPCHLRFKEKRSKEPRRLIQESGLILVERADGPHCCGQGGLFGMSQPELAERIWQDLAAGIPTPGPEIITTTCSGCLLQYRRRMAATSSTARVLHLAELLVRDSGPRSGHEGGQQ